MLIFLSGFPSPPRGSALSNNTTEAQWFGSGVGKDSSVSHCSRGNNKYKGVEIEDHVIKKKIRMQLTCATLTPDTCGSSLHLIN